MYIYTSPFTREPAPSSLFLFWPQRSHASRCQFAGRQPLRCPSGGWEDSPRLVGSFTSMSCSHKGGETATLGGREVRACNACIMVVKQPRWVGGRLKGFVAAQGLSPNGDGSDY